MWFQICCIRQILQMIVMLAIAYYPSCQTKIGTQHVVATVMLLLWVQYDNVWLRFIFIFEDKINKWWKQKILELKEYCNICDCPTRHFHIFFCPTVVQQHISGDTSSQDTFSGEKNSLCFGTAIVHHDEGEAASGDLTNRAEDAFYVVPKRCHLLPYIFRGTKESQGGI